MQEKITIHQLVGKLVVELKRAGFTDSTIWQCYMPRVGSIEHYYEKLGQVYYDPMVTDYLEQKALPVIDDSSMGYLRYASGTSTKGGNGYAE